MLVAFLLTDIVVSPISWVLRPHFCHAFKEPTCFHVPMTSRIQLRHAIIHTFSHVPESWVRMRYFVNIRSYLPHVFVEIWRLLWHCPWISFSHVHLISSMLPLWYHDTESLLESLTHPNPKYLVESTTHQLWRRRFQAQILDSTDRASFVCVSLAQNNVERLHRSNITSTKRPLI